LPHNIEAEQCLIGAIFINNDAFAAIKGLVAAEDFFEQGIKYSKAHLWRLVNAGKFPAPIKIGQARSAWVEAEIDAWIGAKIAERDAVPKGNAA
jgi:prophage regulatory protein